MKIHVGSFVDFFLLSYNLFLSSLFWSVVFAFGKLRAYKHLIRKMLEGGEEAYQSQEECWAYRSLRKAGRGEQEAKGDE